MRHRRKRNLEAFLGETWSVADKMIDEKSIARDGWKMRENWFPTLRQSRWMRKAERDCNWVAQAKRNKSFDHGTVSDRQ